MSRAEEKEKRLLRYDYVSSRVISPTPELRQIVRIMIGGMFKLFYVKNLFARYCNIVVIEQFCMDLLHLQLQYSVRFRFCFCKCLVYYFLACHLE